MPTFCENVYFREEALQAFLLVDYVFDSHYFYRNLLFGTKVYRKLDSVAKISKNNAKLTFNQANHFCTHQN
jgi:hypothetical protein